LREAIAIVGVVQMRRRKRETPPEMLLEPAQDLNEILIQHGGGDRHREQIFMMIDQVVQREMTVAFLRPAFAESQQAAQAAVGGAVRRKNESRNRFFFDVIVLSCQ